MIIAIIAEMSFAGCAVSSDSLLDINQKNIITVTMGDHLESNLVQMNIVMMYAFIEVTTPQGEMIFADKAKSSLAFVADIEYVDIGNKRSRL